MNFIFQKISIFFALGLLLSTSNLAKAQATFDIRESNLATVTVYFASGQDTASAEEIQKLDTLLGLLQVHDSIFCRLTGHTDAEGSAESNLQLSRRRVEFISNALIQKGLPNASIEFAFFGESQPFSTNTTETGKQRNRRVEVHFFVKRAFTVLTGKVVDAKGPVANAEILVSGKDFRDSTRTDEQGIFTLPVPARAVVSIDVISEGYLLKSEFMKIGIRPERDFKMVIKPIEIGDTLDFYDFYFVGGSPVMLPKSKPNLKKLYRFLALNRSVRIEISGHVNVPNRPPVPVGSSEWVLSEKRAETVVSYLIEKGIHHARMEARGFGNLFMRYPKARSAQEQALNRRVQVKVIEK